MKYRVWINDWNTEEDPKEVEAFDEESAAEAIAEMYENDCAEYSEEIEVFVNGKKFIVRCEIERAYYATEQESSNETA